jgi:hypothetical protein
LGAFQDVRKRFAQKKGKLIKKKVREKWFSKETSEKCGRKKDVWIPGYCMQGLWERERKIKD